MTTPATAPPTAPGRPAVPTGRGRVAVLVSVALAVLTGTFAATSPASAVTGEEFKAGVAYNGTFADPHVVKVGRTYVAYATTTASKTLPIMTSTDLRTWTPRYSTDARSAWENDGMPRPASWAKRSFTKRSFVPSWAPAAAQLPNGTWLVAYAPPRAGDGKRCISVATAGNALGPFTDTTRGPVVCPSDQAAIDPYLYRRGDRVWLMWKTQGRPRIEPTKLWSREIDPDVARGGTVSFLPRSRPRLLLATARRWEGEVIENPAMITHEGATYLFYSGNRWTTSKYAVGYARCAGPAGPCSRPAAHPLLAAGSDVWGPGGATPFQDATGQLLMGYAAWRPGQVLGQHKRRLYLARLGVNGDGTLRVMNRVFRPAA